eukprot:2124564-Amphidinium_carterae.2
MRSREVMRLLPRACKEVPSQTSGASKGRCDDDNAMMLFVDVVLDDAMPAASRTMMTSKSRLSWVLMQSAMAAAA